MSNAQAQVCTRLDPYGDGWQGVFAFDPRQGPGVVKAS
jgi:hypothetical protein